MNRIGRNVWIALSVAGAILVGCVAEVDHSLLGSGSADKAAIADRSLPTNGNGNMNGGGCGPCPDFDGDGFVGLGDLGALLAQYGTMPTNPCLDIDGSGFVDLADLGALLAVYDQPCSIGNGNGNDNGVNGNDNGGANGNDNGVNGNDNGGANGNDNGVNGNDNGGANGNDNGVNGNDNGGANGNDNGGTGPCPDGSTQLFAQLSGDDNNRAEYRLLVGGCERFRVRVRELAPFTTYDVVVEGVIVGSISTDDDGRGELEYDSTSGPPFPPGFPDIFAGDFISVGPVSGVFGLDCSSNANCNG